MGEADFVMRLGRQPAAAMCASSKSRENVATLQLCFRHYHSHVFLILQAVCVVLVAVVMLYSSPIMQK